MATADKLIDLFNEAKAKPAGAERERFVAQACGRDSHLKEQVLSLLQAEADEGDSDFLKRTPLIRSTAFVTEKPGDRIGRYKLLQQLGEGGCGVVYMAEQEEPVRRRVALKVIKLGMDTKSVIARFEAERQALALMDHPNIAKVFDAGATETGRPFFVMELVRGIKVTDYCDQNNLTTEQRLELFTQVCRAVQHAHQKGIIHRDIKPSNILVTRHDGVPVPKVIDFGIAKATSDQRLTDKTVFTAFEQFIGTPAYMSPEQAEMSGLDIDTRSDIYSLGVLLYELLTARTPLDPEELLRSGMNEMRRKIREDEPLRPSTCLSTMQAADLTAIATHRQAEAPRLIHLLRGDLDWIVMKCLEKDRTRRYETANGLATDIARHLNNEPIAARPPGKLYLFQKSFRRNRPAYVAAASVIAALVLGLGAFAWMFLRERQAHLTQARLRKEAEIARANEAQLRRKLEVRVTVAQARTVSDSGNHHQAEELLNGIEPSLIEPDANHANLRRRLGWQRVLKGQWSDAAANLAAVLKVDGTAWDREIATDYYFYATALVEAGDEAGYERFRQALVKRFLGAKDPGGAEFCCLITLLRPADPKLLVVLSSLYDTASQRQEYPAERAEEMSENYLRRALVDYRRGNYAKADELIQHCLRPLKDPTIVPTARAIRAMIHRQLRRDEDARLELTTARRAIEPVMQTGPSAFNARQLSQQGRYYEWVQAGIFLREATTLIESQTIPKHGPDTNAEKLNSR